MDIKPITIHSGSYSRLADFEKCKLRAYLKYAARVPEPDRPLRPGQLEHANDRGTRIHTMAEEFVMGRTARLDPLLKHWEPELEKLQRLYGKLQVSLEGEWGYGSDWEPTEWKGAWLRMKLDALVFLNPREAVVVDYKSGKIFGNEIKHNEQGQLYMLGAFMRYPQLEVVHVEFWYIDHARHVDESLKPMTYRRDQGLRFKFKWDKRLHAMTSAVDFPAARNRFACQYCEYGPWNGNQCTQGVR